MRSQPHYLDSILMALCALGLIAADARSETVGPLIEFAPDTPAIAVEVNSNFDALKIGVDDNAGDIDQLESDVANKQDVVTGTCAPGSSIRAIGTDGNVTCEPDNDSGGDITGVTVGSGLIGGGTSGTVSIEADTSVLQLRIGSSCTPGSSIRAIGADGTVDCQTDADSGGDISAVNAGNGLAGGGSEGNVTLSIPVGGVTGSEILNGSITDDDISAVAGIGIGKIFGASGVEFTTRLSGGVLSSGIQDLGEIALTAPGPGFVVVLHSGVYQIGSDIADIGVGTTATAFSQSIQVSNGADGSNAVIPYFVMDIVEVSESGTVTFFALAENRSFRDGFLQIAPSFLAAIFIPNRY